MLSGGKFNLETGDLRGAAFSLQFFTRQAEKLSAKL